MTEAEIHGAYRQDDISLTDPAFFAHGDPHRIWRQLRDEDPVHLTRGRLRHAFWSLTRYADARFVLSNDDRLFSVQRCGANLPMGPEFEIEGASIFTELAQSGQQLAVMDGAPHTELRAQFWDFFGPKGVEALTVLVRSIANEMLDKVLDRGECDFTTAFAGLVPTAVIAAILGIPREHWDDLYRWNNMLASPDDPEFSVGTPLQTNTAGVTGIMNVCATLAEAYRGSGKTNLLTRMTEIAVGGKRLSQAEIGFNGLMFFGAGHETTRASMSTGLFELLADRAQFAYLYEHRHEPKILRAAAEEFVRFSSPLTHTLRVAVEDTEINGRSIRAGDWVVVWFHGANRDPAAFQNPESFDIRRAPNQHLGFAVGKHFCLGTHLARLDMQIMLETIFEKMTDIELAGPVEFSASNLFWGIKHMPIRFRRRQ